MHGCLHAQAPREDELVRYVLEGESLPHLAQEHIVQCNSCRQQLEIIMSTHSFLLRRLYRCRCPDIDVLARYSAGLASLYEGLFVLYHLQSCPLCAHDLQDMQNMLEEDPLWIGTE